MIKQRTYIQNPRRSVSGPGNTRRCRSEIITKKQQKLGGFVNNSLADLLLQAIFQTVTQ